MDEALEAAADTKALRFGAGALEAVDAVFEQAFGAAAAVIVADQNTFRVAGAAVQDRLAQAGRPLAEPIIFPGLPVLYASYENVLALEERLRSVEAIPVVVGSGTLNDLTKLAAHRAGRPYMVVATAASMDGYTAFGAAITKDNFKQTISCPAPRAVLADLDVLAQAPREMNSTGYGDLLGKVTAGADWILADALGIEPIDTRAWALVQQRLRDWTAEPARLQQGEPQQIASLFEGLIMSGVAMQISASSRPASGSEHRFSHLWEMQALVRGEEAIPHGFKVGIGTIAAAAFYERILTRDLTNIDVDALCAAWPTREQVATAVRGLHDDAQLAENAVAESLAKYIDADGLRARLLLLQEIWPELRHKLQAQLLPAHQLRDMLAAAGCPIDPAAIGISPQRLRESYEQARTIRSRYTVLDLAYETGLLDQCVAELFAPGGFWEGGKQEDRN